MLPCYPMRCRLWKKNSPNDVQDVLMASVGMIHNPERKLVNRSIVVPSQDGC